MSASSPSAPALPGVVLPRPLSLLELQQAYGGILDAAAHSCVVHAVADPVDADSRCLAPVFGVRALRTASLGRCPVLVDETVANRISPGRRWVHRHARWVFAKILHGAAPPTPAARRSSLALLEPGVVLGHNVDVGPGAVILRGARLGDDCSVAPNAVIYGGACLGNRVAIGPGAVIGRPGFGWAHGIDGEALRIPQLGGVILEDDVEVGALATVDAGTLRPTRLRRGCRLDAHVHVGHNADIGEHTIVAAQSGFAGSVRLGRGVLVGGQVGVADHAVVGDCARLAGRAGVIGDVPAGQTFAGYPAVERMRWLRAIANLMRGRRL